MTGNLQAAASQALMLIPCKGARMPMSAENDNIEGSAAHRSEGALYKLLAPPQRVCPECHDQQKNASEKMASFAFNAATVSAERDSWVLSSSKNRPEGLCRRSHHQPSSALEIAKFVY